MIDDDILLLPLDDGPGESKETPAPRVEKAKAPKAPPSGPSADWEPEPLVVEPDVPLEVEPEPSSVALWIKPALTFLLGMLTGAGLNRWWLGRRD